MHRRARAWCCWRRHAAATATWRSGSRWRGAARPRATTWRIRPTWKAACRMRRTWPACPTASRCCCPARCSPSRRCSRTPCGSRPGSARSAPSSRWSCCTSAHDALLADVAQRVARSTGLPLVAAGDVLMHVRSRKPLQDVLTATRLNTPVAECGFALAAQCRGAPALAPAAGGAVPAPSGWPPRCASPARCAFSLDELRYEYPEEIVPAGHTPDQLAARS